MPERRVCDTLLALASVHVGHLIGGQLYIASILRLDRQLRKHALAAVLGDAVNGQLDVAFLALNEAALRYRGWCGGGPCVFPRGGVIGTATGGSCTCLAAAGSVFDEVHP